MTEPASSLDQDGFRTLPTETERMPAGIPFIVGNEAAERFSFYGMRAILTVFMIQHLKNAAGELAPMSKPDATSWFHAFLAAGYFFPVIGAFVADWWLGKYKTILILSIVYCLGHLALAVDETRLGLFVGLSLIAVAMGAIKPCVSAHVGDQFGKRNAHLMSKVFGWFYVSINVGAFLSTLITPYLLDEYNAQVAFGVPGVLMAVATLVFWLGRYRFIHVPPRGKEFVADLTSPDFLSALLALTPIYICVAAFWCLFDQTGSKWVQQAQEMNCVWLGIEWKESQLQAMNPALILILVPLFAYVVYPAIDRVWRLTPLRKIGLGMFLTATVFVISGLIQVAIDQGHRPSIGWQVFAYVPLTAAEVMVSITCLEFSYTQAPKSMKSIIMSFYMLSVTAGNLLTAWVNQAISLNGADYYWFFAAVMLLAAIAYVGVAMRYRGRTFVEGVGY
jgi:POT family proton-dependent oligopeptide transporter